MVRINTLKGNPEVHYPNGSFGERDFIKELAAKDAEIARLHAALAPILAHADAHDYAPPIRFSVQQCREMKEKADG